MASDNKQTKLLRWLLPFICSTVLVAMTPYIMAKTTALGKTASPPPSVELQYIVRVKMTAMSIGGKSTIQWDNKGDQYAIHTSAKANLIGQVLESSSKGHIDAQGLKPDIFREKRIRKDETITEFNRTANTVTFSESQQTIPLEKEVQDRASIVWQLVSMARAAPEKFSPGSKLTQKVIGRKEIDLWHFAVLEEVTLQTALGDIRTIHIERRDNKNKTTEVWLAPEKEWYPVKLIFDDNKNFRLEQSIQTIIPK
ncbi:MAG: DUF3108 domain-containing protein [Betaproteobacteria bacterium]|nr:DUF3108 domain-containing protein [Betaproteobacteria bacterium]